MTDQISEAREANEDELVAELRAARLAAPIEVFCRQAGLKKRIGRMLEIAAVETVRDLVSYAPEDITAIKGLGTTAFEDLRTALEANELGFAGDWNSTEPPLFVRPGEDEA